MPGGGKIVASRTPSVWLVRWHPQAIVEKNGIEDSGERVAIAHAIEKLQVDGPALAHPHQSAVLGEEGRVFGSCVPGEGEAARVRSTAGLRGRCSRSWPWVQRRKSTRQASSVRCEPPGCDLIA